MGGDAKGVAGLANAAGDTHGGGFVFVAP
jgi:hypothetical protein